MDKLAEWQSGRYNSCWICCCSASWCYSWKMELELELKPSNSTAKRQFHQKVKFANRNFRTAQTDPRLIGTHVHSGVWVTRFGEQRAADSGMRWSCTQSPPAPCPQLCFFFLLLLSYISLLLLSILLLQLRLQLCLQLASHSSMLVPAILLRFHPSCPSQLSAATGKDSSHKLPGFQLSAGSSLTGKKKWPWRSKLAWDNSAGGQT
ncbi:uncharacterized protein ASCRUDRAFT_97198 [Ascoidea rubescens DSM 1968]|uniref:Uncharacterized protein n=1 Tax=Ascoidea rubescens DSM 1968 TaxID=1344418 RepID=A0A1D2VPN7_9ASCO|nr:hypothetical protein ASCRUDRAFT_97198 [Ascoidea rubescens DSM 1968]ODV63583.1 hypothetical protein ASCRUDRAFT_97198 [Ascoidea rubescens DSM 1968]